MPVPVIAYDPGFGNTKVCVDGRVSTLQSAVSRPQSIGLAAIGMKTAGRNVPIVEFANQRLAVGPGSWNLGQPLTSLDYYSLVTPERLALFYAALSEVVPSDLQSVTLVIGLPVPLLQDKSQAELVLESVKQLKRVHEFSIGDSNFVFNIHAIKVLAQPVGAYIDWLYDDQFNIRSGANKAEVAIIDIGLNTLDLYVVMGGQVSERHIGGAEVGVQRLLELVAYEGRDLMEADATLRNGSLKIGSSHLDMWLGEILAAIKRTWSSFQRFTVVIPTGGGALVLGDRLKTTLAAKGAAIHWPTDPITANVCGFWKYGARYVSGH